MARVIMGIAAVIALPVAARVAPAKVVHAKVGISAAMNAARAKIVRMAAVHPLLASPAAAASRVAHPRVVAAVSLHADHAAKFYQAEHSSA